MATYLDAAKAVAQAEKALQAAKAKLEATRAGITKDAAEIQKLLKAEVTPEVMAKVAAIASKYTKSATAPKAKAPADPNRPHYRRFIWQSPDKKQHWYDHNADKMVVLTDAQKQKGNYTYPNETITTEKQALAFLKAGYKAYMEKPDPSKPVWDLSKAEVKATKPKKTGKG